MKVVRPVRDSRICRIANKLHDGIQEFSMTPTKPPDLAPCLREIRLNFFRLQIIIALSKLCTQLLSARVVTIQFGMV
jgi:hypothetical protein